MRVTSGPLPRHTDWPAVVMGMCNPEKQRARLTKLMCRQTAGHRRWQLQRLWERMPMMQSALLTLMEKVVITSEQGWERQL